MTANDLPHVGTLKKSNELLKAIDRAQAAFITNADPTLLFRELLENILALTESEYGFIGETFFDSDGTIFLKTRAISDISWSAEIKAFYDENLEKGMEFKTHGTLFGAVLKTGKPVISNAPDNDPRRGGIPKGHPPIRAFMGIPFHSGGEFIGMIGMANRPGGYNEDLIDDLHPLLVTSGNLIRAYRIDMERRKAKEELERHRAHLEELVEERTSELKSANIRLNHEIEERKRIQQELRQREDRLETILENAPIMICGFDSEKRMVLWNRECENRLGWDRRQLTDWTDIQKNVFPDATAFHLVEDAINKADGIFREFSVITRNGAMRTQLLAWFLLHDNTTISVGYDITDRKKLEEELRKAMQSARDANMAKSAFLANMSHEIRTPINAVIGLSGLAMETDIANERNDYLKGVGISAEMLLSVIDDILDFSKIEAGKIEIKTTPFSIRDCVGDTLRTLAFKAEESNLELIHYFMPEVPTIVQGDPGRLSQVILNLVGNALKFTEKGEVALFADIESEKKDGIVLHFRVRDTGPGIPEENREQIFKPFSQGDETIVRKHGGTGLGLTICSHLIQMMNGRIWVESELGKGSTFHFTAAFGLDRKAITKVVTVEQTLLADVPALIVANTATVGNIIQDMLSFRGMQPAVANGGLAALEMMRNRTAEGNPFAVVLVGPCGPGMNGPELVREIRAHPAYAKTAVIMFTSTSCREESSQCRAAGANVCLKKPFKESDLLNAVITSLGGETETSDLKTGAELPSRSESAKRLSILLAEDNEFNQILGVRLLEKVSQTVEIAKNGKEVLDILNQKHIDLILMDIQMPEMDGFETTAIIREKEKTTGGRIPIVAVTAFAMRGDRERCIAAGMDGYLSKPIRQDELYQIIEELTDVPVGEKQENSRPMPEETIVDRKTMLHIVNGQTDILKDVIGIFFTKLSDLLDMIQSHIEKKDPEGLANSAHSLKGMLANVAAGNAAKAAANIEKIGKNGDLSAAKAAYEKLAKETERLKPELEGILKDIEAGKPLI